MVHRFNRHRFSRKFRFNRQFKKMWRPICGSLALQKLDLVENFDSLENFASWPIFLLNRYSTVLGHFYEGVISLVIQCCFGNLFLSKLTVFSTRWYIVKRKKLDSSLPFKYFDRFVSWTLQRQAFLYNDDKIIFMDKKWAEFVLPRWLQFLWKGLLMRSYFNSLFVQ